MDHLTADEVADILRLSYTSVTRLAASGELPAVKIKDVWQFKPTDVAAYIARHSQEVGDVAA